MPVQVNVAADQQNLINSIERGVRAYNQRFSKSNTINLNINERGFTQPLGRITGAVNDFESAMAASNARVIAFGASTAVLGTAIAGFRSLAKASIEVEKNLADVNRILQLSTSDLQTFGKELFNISKRTATSFNDASKALLEFSRQGLSAEETLRRTNDALTLTRLAGLGAEASVAALTATVNGFAKSGITTTQVLNKLVAVEQAFAVSARDLSEGLSRTGQAAQEAGVNIDQLNALISAAQQRTARGGAVIGNALKTIFTRLQRSDTLDRLEEFNIAVRDVQGNTLPATTVLQNFANAYNRLADAQRAQLSEQVAGVYQVNILKAIVSDLNSEQSIYNAALIKGASATNEASRANAQLNQTLSALLVQVGNNTQQLASTIGSVTFEPLAKSAAKAANSIVEAITDVITGEGLGSDLANGLLKGIRNVLAGPGAIAAFYTLFKLVQSSFTYVAQALPQIAGITTETQKRQNLEQAILGILQSENNISKSILGNTGNQKRQAEILLGVARQQTAQYREQLALANSLAGTLRNQGVSVGARGLQAGRTRSGGYIPASTRMAERAGAFAGGYAPGKVVNSPVGGVMNTAEDIKYMPGFAQPFINPPKNSRAGRLHRANAVRQVGVDPYQYRGFVPNFSSLSLGSLSKYKRSKTEIEQYADVEGSNINTRDTLDSGYDKIINFDATKVKGYGKLLTSSATGKASKSFGDKFEKAILKAIKTNNAAAFEGGISQSLRKLQAAHNLKGGFSSAIDFMSADASILAEAKGGFYDDAAGDKPPRAIAENLRRAEFARLFTSQGPEYIDTENILIQNKNFGYGKKQQARLEKNYGNINVDKTYLVKRNKNSGHIPNFAAGYRNPFTGALNNAAIARGIRTGALTEKQAQEMGYATSSSKIGARKAKRAAAVGALNYQMVYVPWDIEGFRGGRSGGRLNIAQGTAYESFILNLLRSGQLKGTTSLGQSFSLPARPDVVSSAALKGGSNARIDGYSLSAGEMYEMKAGGTGNTASGLQDKFIKAIENNPEILNPKRKWKNYIFRTTAAKGRGASGGFIPNLAYKGEVMDLEEFISGQKAIYSETPFPHVRNASQPTFASAIADHGGLGNALKDSYRNQSAAGMVYGGYVPNFAPKGTITAKAAGIDNLSAAGSELQKTFYKLQGAMRKLTQSTDLSTKQRDILRQDLRTYARTIDSATGSTKALDSVNKALANSKKKNKAAVDTNTSATKKNTSSGRGGGGGLLGSGGRTALAFGGPMIAGLIEQAAFGNRQRIDLSENERAVQSTLSTGLTSISTGFAIAGPIGALAGAAVGAASAINAMSLTAEEYTQLADKFNSTTQENAAAAKQYIEAQKSMASSLSGEDFQLASDSAAQALKKIKDVNLQKSFEAAGNDVKKLTESLKTYEQTRLSGLNRANQLALSKQTGEANETGFIASILQLEEFFPTTKRRSGALQNLGYRTDVSETGSITLNEGSRSKVLRDYFQLFDDLSEVTEGELDDFVKLIEEQKSNKFFDTDAVARFFQDVAGLDFVDAQSNADLLDILEDGSNVVGQFIFKNFKSLVDDIKAKDFEVNLGKILSESRGAAADNFNNIFRSINDSFDRISNETLNVLEQARSDQQINKTILDFTTSFTDSISSFVSSNLPDLERYQFAQSAARQKANNQLAQLAQDSDNFEQNQINQRRQALEKNADEISASFEKNLFQSQAVGEIFRDRILPQLKQGNYNINIDEIQKQSQKDAVLEFNKKYFSEYPQVGIFGEVNDVGQLTDNAYGNLSQEEASKRIKKETARIEKQLEYLNRVKGGAEPSYEGSVETAQKQYDKLIQKAKDLQELEKAVGLTQEEKSKAELESLLKRKQDEQKLFEASAANAKKEFELNKALSEQRIKAEETLAVQKARIDEKNLARTRAAEITSSRLGFASNIDQARRREQIALSEDAMNDPRANYGLGLKEITERRIKAEEDIIQQRRAAEDAQLDIEMKQSYLRLNAEIQNTNALNDLNQTVLRLIGVQLSGDAEVKQIKDFVSLPNNVNVDDETIKRTFGDQAANKFFAFREVESSLSLQTGTRSSALEEALEKQKESGEIDKEALRIAAEKDGWSKMELKMLEEELENRKDVLEIERRIDDTIRGRANARAREGVDLGGNFRAGIGAMKSESDAILNNLAREAPSRFADGMANALSEVAQGTKSLGDAFTDMAIDFGRMLQQEVFRALAQRAVGSALTGLFGTAGSAAAAAAGNMRGGIIKAQNGMYISGGRTGDRNLALLEDGEYVLNRNAVRMMGGPKGLDNLNFNMAPRFASGGAYSLRPEQQRLKSGELDFTGNYISSNSAGRINDDMFTSYALAEDKYFQDKKQKAREALERRIQKNYERKMKRAQLISSIVAAAGSIMMAYGASGMAASSAAGAQGKAALQAGQMTGADAATQAGLQQAASKSNYAFGQFMQKNANNILVNNIPLNTLASSVSGTLSETVSGLRKIGANDAYINNFLSQASAGPVGKGVSGMTSISSGLSSQGIVAAQKASKAGLFSRLFSSGAGIASGIGKRQVGGIIGYNSGGFVPHGSRLSDTIPAMLTGGEYIMNNKAVKKYGLGTMNAMNSGAYQSGGMASSTTNNNSTSNNNTNISVKIDRAGNSVFGADSNSYEQNDVIMSKKMAKQINSIVLRTISNEKRYGGELSKNDLG